MARNQQNQQNQQNQRVGPYDRPYYNKRQERQEQMRRTREATAPLSEIETQTRRERAGAEAITGAFEDMLRRQQERALQAQLAIQGAAGGAGSALTTAAVTGEQQALSAAPIIATGEGARIQSDINKRDREARQKRNEEYRKNLAYFGEKVREEEREKQATRIERAAAEKAYDLKQKDYERSVYESDRNYELAVQRVNNALANSASGDISDVIKSIDAGAKAALKGSGEKKGTGKWSGSVKYWNSTDSRWETLKVSTPINLPASNRDKFWKDYVKKKTGFETDRVDRGGMTEETKSSGASVDDVASALYDGLISQGFAEGEAYQMLLRSAFGMANAAAVKRAAGY